MGNGTAYADIEAAFAGSGLLVRGGFHPPADDMLGGVRSIVLIGNAGPEFWNAFAAGRRDEPEPLDAWTRRMVEPLAAALGARAVYPNDRPYQPFQRWAQQAEPVSASPLGILIHPRFGLWHAYRAALVFVREVTGLPARDEVPSPCDTCIGRPCLSACPVDAFDGRGYDVAACARHLRGLADPDCASLGCRARDACPVAPEWRYLPAQAQFHMAAFVRARVAR
jgi:hypothetical protein